jgi:hypothetical protein
MVNDRSRRRELTKAYASEHPEAGVYRIRNAQTGRVLIASATNLAGARNRFAFARSTNAPGALDLRLREDIRVHGLAALELEVLERFVPAPERTSAEIRSELDIMESLWREGEDPALLYS